MKLLIFGILWSSVWAAYSASFVLNGAKNTAWHLLVMWIHTLFIGYFISLLLK